MSKPEPTERHEAVIDYLMNNYYDDVERLANIRMVKEVIAQVGEIDKIPSLIDKVALFNGIKKTYPPSKEYVEAAAKEFVAGVNFIMFLGRTEKDREL